jgi:hypothetical protein
MPLLLLKLVIRHLTHGLQWRLPNRELRVTFVVLRLVVLYWTLPVRWSQGVLLTLRLVHLWLLLGVRVALIVLHQVVLVHVLLIRHFVRVEKVVSRVLLWDTIGIYHHLRTVLLTYLQRGRCLISTNTGIVLLCHDYWLMLNFSTSRRRRLGQWLLGIMMHCKWLWLSFCGAHPLIGAKYFSRVIPHQSRFWDIYLRRSRIRLQKLMIHLGHLPHRLSKLRRLWLWLLLNRIIFLLLTE